MRRMGIMSVAPKPNTSKSHPKHKKYPYLLRHFTIDRANQVWCPDITYIRLPGGFIYLKEYGSVTELVLALKIPLRPSAWLVMLSLKLNEHKG